MQSANDHDIFTIKDAQALRSRFISLLLERDELSTELEAHRQVLAELEDLRRFLAGDPVSFVTTATTNGHLHTASAQANDDLSDTTLDSEPDTLAAIESQTPRDTEDAISADVTDPDAAGPEPAVVECETPPHTEEPLADERRDEAAAPEASPEQTGDASDAGEAEPPAVDSHRVTQTTPPNRDTAATRPPPGTLMERIFQLIERSDRPKRPWQVQKELNLPRMPSAELSRLVTMGCLIRPKEGVYAVPGRDYRGSS